MTFQFLVVSGDKKRLWFKCGSSGCLLCIQLHISNCVDRISAVIETIHSSFTNSSSTEGPVVIFRDLWITISLIIVTIKVKASSQTKLLFLYSSTTEFSIFDLSNAVISIKTLFQILNVDKLFFALAGRGKMTYKT